MIAICWPTSNLDLRLGRGDMFCDKQVQFIVPLGVGQVISVVYLIYQAFVSAHHLRKRPPVFSARVQSLLRGLHSLISTTLLPVVIVTVLIKRSVFFSLAMCEMYTVVIVVSMFLAVKTCNVLLSNLLISLWSIADFFASATPPKHLWLYGSVGASSYFVICKSTSVMRSLIHVFTSPSMCVTWSSACIRSYLPLSARNLNGASFMVLTSFPCGVWAYPGLSSLLFLNLGFPFLLSNWPAHHGSYSLHSLLLAFSPLAQLLCTLRYPVGLSRVHALCFIVVYRVFGIFPLLISAPLWPSVSLVWLLWDRR